MFRKFRLFFTGMWTGVIILLVLLVWMQSSPNPAMNRILQYRDILVPGNKGETILVERVKKYLHDSEEVIMEKSELTLAELKMIMKDNPNLKFELDPLSLKLTISDMVENELISDPIKLGPAGDYLGVYRKEYDGSDVLDRITRVKIKDLPLDWQASLLEGELEFADEISLLEALDSLDEFQARL